MCHVFLIQLPYTQRQCDFERYLMAFESQKYVLQAYFLCPLPAFFLDKKGSSPDQELISLKAPRLDKTVHMAPRCISEPRRLWTSKMELQKGLWGEPSASLSLGDHSGTRRLKQMNTPLGWLCWESSTHPVHDGLIAQSQKIC